jgi:hypothetical protein
MKKPYPALFAMAAALAITPAALADTFDFTYFRFARSGCDGHTHR